MALLTGRRWVESFEQMEMLAAGAMRSCGYGS